MLKSLTGLEELTNCKFFSVESLRLSFPGSGISQMLKFPVKVSNDLYLVGEVTLIFKLQVSLFTKVFCLGKLDSGDFDITGVTGVTGGGTISNSFGGDLL